MLTPPRLGEEPALARLAGNEADGPPAAAHASGFVTRRFSRRSISSLRAGFIFSSHILVKASENSS